MKFYDIFTVRTLITMISEIIEPLDEGINGDFGSEGFDWEAAHDEFKKMVNVAEIKAGGFEAFIELLDEAWIDHSVVVDLMQIQ